MMKGSPASQGTPLTRREFVTATAGLAAGSIAAHALPTFAFAAGSDAIKVGLVGCGGRGTGAADQALSADPGVVLWAMADVFKDRIDGSLAALQNQLKDKDKDQGESAGGTKGQQKVQVAEDRRFIGFDAYQKLIASGVDVVILATPPVFRPMHLRAALEAGKHVFCEKPMAVDAPGVRSVLESAALAEKKKLSLVSGFCWRYSDAERATFAKIHDGAVGDIRAVYTTYNVDGWAGTHPREVGWSAMEWQLRNWHYFYWLSGDHIVEQACHSIDKMAWALKDEPPAQCTAVGGRQARQDIPETGNVYDHFAVTYEFASGARGFHMCRQIAHTPFDNTDLILGTKGKCFINGWAPTHVIEGESPWHYEGQRRNMYQNEHDALFASIRSGKPMNDGVRMAHSTLTAIMARLAAYTGQVVTWEQALASKENLTPQTWEWGDVPVAPVPVPGRTKLS